MAGARGTPVCAHLCRVCNPEAAGALNTHGRLDSFFFREMLVLKQKKELPFGNCQVGGRFFEQTFQGLRDQID